MFPCPLPSSLAAQTRQHRPYPASSAKRLITRQPRYAPRPVRRHTACHIEALKSLLEPLIAAHWRPTRLSLCLCHSLRPLLWVGRPPPQNWLLWFAYWTCAARPPPCPPCLGKRINRSSLTVHGCFRVLQVTHERPFQSTSDSDRMSPYLVNISSVLRTLRDISHTL